MINSNIYPSDIVGYIINAVRGDPPQFRNLEIMNPDLLRIALRTKFLATILEVTHKLLLFGVHRNDGRVKEAREEQKKVIEMELYTEGIFAEIIKSGIETGVFREVDPTMTSAVLKAMLQDWYLKTWKYQRRKLS